jgi:hypothetical protein
MNLKKCFIVLCFILLVSGNLLAQSKPDKSIEGIYRVGEAAPIGIKVEKLSDGRACSKTRLVLEQALGENC